MRPFEAFHEAAGYYGTLIDEAAHDSGAKHRLDRDFHECFRCDVLAIEEATAELAASFVLADLGIAHHPRRDRAAYIASWLEVLKGDARHLHRRQQGPAGRRLDARPAAQRRAGPSRVTGSLPLCYAACGPSRIVAAPIRQIAAIDVLERISSTRPTFSKGWAPR
jgi:hypothetical protein